MAAGTCSSSTTRPPRCTGRSPGGTPAATTSRTGRNTPSPSRRPPVDRMRSVAGRGCTSPGTTAPPSSTPGSPMSPANRRYASDGAAPTCWTGARRSSSAPPPRPMTSESCVTRSCSSTRAGNSRWWGRGCVTVRPRCSCTTAATNWRGATPGFSSTMIRFSGARAPRTSGSVRNCSRWTGGGFWWFPSTTTTCWGRSSRRSGTSSPTARACGLSQNQPMSSTTAPTATPPR